MDRFYVGIDAHQRKLAVCILNSYGQIVKEQVYKSDPALVLADLERLKGRAEICYEASCDYGYLYDRFCKLPNLGRIAVAHPGEVRLIFRAKRKNDRVDARKLAKLLYLDEVPPVHVPNLDVREWRGLIEFRRKLVSKRTAAKNQIRAVLRTHGIVAPFRTRLWTRNGIAWLKTLELPSALSAVRRDALLEELDSHEARIGRVEGLLDDIGAKHPGVHLLRTIPGVGPRTAEAIVAYVDDPRRFARTKQLGCYLGLVPCQDQSADRNRLGHITRNGPATARMLLTEAVWQGIRLSPEIRAFYERIRGDDPGRNKIALVATANWLARIMLAMMRTGEVCRFTRFPRKPRKAKSREKESGVVEAPQPAAVQMPAPPSAAA